MTPRASSQTLTDHEEIRRWAEARDATPACVRNTGRGKDVGMIRLDFPGYSGAGSLEEISWDQWFGKFDDSNLALIVQNKTARGQRSNFNKLIGRAAEERTGKHRGTRRRAHARRTRGRTRTSARGRSPQAARSARRSRSARKTSASRSSKTATAKRKTSARRSRSSSRRGGARVVSISTGRSKRVQGRAGRKRTNARSRQPRRRAA